jgi:hypothetical protein
VRRPRKQLKELVFEADAFDTHAFVSMPMRPTIQPFARPLLSTLTETMCKSFISST